VKSIRDRDRYWWIGIGVFGLIAIPALAAASNIEVLPEQNGLLMATAMIFSGAVMFFAQLAAPREKRQSARKHLRIRNAAIVGVILGVPCGVMGGAPLALVVNASFGSQPIEVFSGAVIEKRIQSRSCAVVIDDLAHRRHVTLFTTRAEAEQFKVGSTFSREFRVGCLGIIYRRDF
jgi:hypothetical protein